VTRTSSRSSAIAASASVPSCVSMNPCSSARSASVGSSGGPVGPALLHRRAGALERAVGRRHAGVEQRRGLGGRPAEHVAQERLLHEILGLLEGAEHPVAVHVQLPPVALHQHAEGRLVAELVGIHVG
jgi:hypothetical protein